MPLGPDTAYQIKARIWDDATHAEIQEEFRVSYQTSVNIKGGRQYSHIPWPDGSVGAFPKARTDQIADNKRYATRTGKSPGAAPTIVAPPLKLVRELDEAAQKLGFGSIAEMQQHFFNEVINERIRKEVEAQRLRSEAYEESERIRMLPENVEKRRLERSVMEVERDDLCDPELQEMIPEEELEGLDIPVVQVAQSEGDKSLLLAIRICFGLFTRRQWSQDHVLKNIYMIKGKIEKFWDENPERRPAGE